MKLKFKKLRDVETPKRLNPTDSGIDFYIPNSMSYSILAWHSITIPSWIEVDIEEGYDLVFHRKSGLAQNGLFLWAHVVDAGFKWEVLFNLYNFWRKELKLEWGTRVVQGIVRKVELCEIEEMSDSEEVKETKRGKGWFGSTWLK